MEMREHEDRAAQAVADQAAEWFIRLKDRDLSIADRRRFVRWLKQSPGNIAEFMRLAQLYGRVKRANVPTLPPEELAASENVIELGPREFLPPPEPRAGFFDSRGVRFAAVACGLALVAVVGVIANFVMASNTIETHISEWRKVHLADGTQISAGPNTLLLVDYSEGVRRIQLQRGEAMFSVTKDTSRPFIVDAGGAIVRAVGTRFGVDRREDSVRITVAEGKVAVVRGDQAAALEKAVDMRIAIPLTQDQRVEFKVNAPSMTPQVETVNSTSALAWANGQLVFQNATLGEAVQEFNRRNQIQIEVDDPTVAAWHVCCVFDAADPKAFAESIAMDDAIALERAGPNTLRLVPQAPGQAEAPVKDGPI
jgi:transmembrane sensor